MNPKVQEVIAEYPDSVQIMLRKLRALIYQIAQEERLGDVEESLKWQEPSYLVKSGTAVRMDWKAKTPAFCCLYFNCQSKLIPTFRELYSEQLRFQGNRAIELPVNLPLSEKEIRHCLSLAMRYKKIKHLPLLGA